MRKNSFMILRERRKNVIHLLCASTSAHIFCMSENMGVFPRVNIDARRTSDQRQSNVRHKYTTRSTFVVFSLTEVCPSHTYTTQSQRMKKKLKKKNCLNFISKNYRNFQHLNPCIVRNTTSTDFKLNIVLQSSKGYALNW